MTLVGYSCCSHYPDSTTAEDWKTDSNTIPRAQWQRDTRDEAGIAWKDAPFFLSWYRAPCWDRCGSSRLACIQSDANIIVGPPVLRWMVRVHGAHDVLRTSWIGTRLPQVHRTEKWRPLYWRTVSVPKSPNFLLQMRTRCTQSRVNWKILMSHRIKFLRRTMVM